MLVLWPPPNEHQVALNVDGSSYGNPGRAGFGGLIRDHTGSWIIGFSGHVRLADSVEVELLAIVNGLMLAWEYGYRDVSCRTDCTKAISLIQDPTSEPHKYVEITKSIKELMSRDWIVSLVHTYREGNQCADFMAKLGANATDYNLDCVGIFPEPLPCLSSLLLSDAKRTPYARV